MALRMRTRMIGGTLLFMLIFYVSRTYHGQTLVHNEDLHRSATSVSQHNTQYIRQPAVNGTKMVQTGGSHDDEDDLSDDYSYDENEDNAELMKLVKLGGFERDEEARRVMFAQFKQHLPRAFPVSNKNATNEGILQMKSSPQIGLLSGDALVRNCITGGIIGRTPANIKTRIFTPDVFDVISESAEDGAVRRQAFMDIFNKQIWGHSWETNITGPDASGRGATLVWTQEVIATLHNVINNIKLYHGKTSVRLLDVPCGDMSWMRRFLETRDDVHYVGMDIVPDLIQQHQRNFKDRGWEFHVLDLVDDSLTGEYDLVLSRTLLQHLYTPDAIIAMHKISQIGSGYLLTTTFSKMLVNSELIIDAENPGRVHELNLEIPPFSLKPPVCISRDGPPYDFEGWKHFIGLWKLPLEQVVDCKIVKKFRLMGTSQDMYSCIEWSHYIDIWS